MDLRFFWKLPLWLGSFPSLPKSLFPRQKVFVFFSSRLRDLEASPSPKNPFTCQRIFVFCSIDRQGEGKVLVRVYKVIVSVSELKGQARRGCSRYFEIDRIGH